MEVVDQHHRTMAAQRASSTPSHGEHAGEEGRKRHRHRNPNLGDWVVRGHERKRGTNRSGEVEERSEGSVLPQRTAAEVAGAGRRRTAPPQATREPEELEHGLVLVRVRSVRERVDWFG